MNTTKASSSRSARSSGKLSFSTLLRRSIAHRRARSLSALVALTVSASVATALLTLYASLDAKLHHEFRSFGANIVLTEPAGSGLPPDAQLRVRVAAGSDAVSVPFGYAVATAENGTPVVVVGTETNELPHLNPTWQFDDRSRGPGVIGESAVIGVRAAQFVTGTPTLLFNNRPLNLSNTRELKTGAEEDSRIYIPLTRFTEWTGQPATVLQVQAAGGEARINDAIVALRREFPGASVQPIRQLVEGESRIVDRTHTLMYGAVVLIALTVGLSVLATLSASILERRRDFALMKALGGSQAHLLALFLVEALVLAIFAVAAGWLLGSGAAAVISQLNFHTSTAPHPGVLPLVLLLNITIAAAAALLPARVLRGIQPAALLKGD